MYNPIIGQTTINVIETIHNHGRINYNLKGRNLVVDKNVTINRATRYVFNHNFNRNRYVRKRK